MIKKKPTKQKKNPAIREIEKLLNQQTDIILSAVDKRLDWHKKESDEKFARIEKEIKEIRHSINQLAITLDKFLKRLTDFDDEFQILKARLTKVEKILRDKMGMTID